MLIIVTHVQPQRLLVAFGGWSFLRKREILLSHTQTIWHDLNQDYMISTLICPGSLSSEWHSSLEQSLGIAEKSVNPLCGVVHI